MTWSLEDDHLRGEIDATRDSLTLSSLRGRVDLATIRSLPIWPAGVSARLARTEGSLRVERFEGTRRGGRWVDLRGTLEGEGLAWQAQERWDVGGVRLILGADRPSVGEVVDTGGPLEIKAALSRGRSRGPSAPVMPHGFHGLACSGRPTRSVVTGSRSRAGDREPL